MNNKSRHQEIFSELKAEILAGTYDSAKRLPSEAQLVARFGVSRPTVARALQELKLCGMLERKAGSGTYLKKNAELPARTQQIGLLVPGLGKIEIFDVICGELASLARVHDLGMHWGGSAHPRVDSIMSVAEAEDLCEYYIEKGVSGVFFAPFEHTTNNEAANRRIAERLSHSGIPVVLIDRDLCIFPQRSNYDLVGMDNFAAGYLLAEHLIKLGVRRIEFVSRPLSATTVDARKAGAITAMMSNRVAISKEFHQQGNCTEVEFVRRLTNGKRLDAVICANDHTAAQLLQTLARLNIDTPRDLRVVGFDDVRFATLLHVPLTTIQQPCRNIALTAFNAMRERLTDPTLPARSLLVTPSLIVRESCGAYLVGASRAK